MALRALFYIRKIKPKPKQEGGAEDAGVRVRIGAGMVGGRHHLAGKVVSVDLGSVGQLLGLVSQGRWELQFCKRLVKLALDVLGTWHLHDPQWTLETVTACNISQKLRQNERRYTSLQITVRASAVQQHH